MSQSSSSGPAAVAAAALAAALAAQPLPDKLWVRIHPYNPSQGHRKRTFLVHGFPTAFTVEAGWYELDARIAVQLRKFRNNANDEGSKPIFQVVTKDKAREIDVRARRKAAEADSPNRIATNPLQDRLEVPKPVDLSVLDKPLEVAPTNPEEPPTGVADMLQELVDEETAEGIEPAIETDLPEERGDLTTEDLKPKTMPVPAPTPPAPKLVPRATKKPKA